MLQKANNTSSDVAKRWSDAMRQGNEALAWTISDTIMATRDPATRDDPKLPHYQRWVWDGRRLEHSDVFVRCYHGLGDTLQFARFLAALRRRAASVTLEAPVELLPLLASVPGLDRLVPCQHDARVSTGAVEIEIMELSHALRAKASSAPPPYLVAAPSAQPPGTVGFCWRAGGWDPTRSVPEALLASLMAGQPALSLQQGPTTLPVLNPTGPTTLPTLAADIAGLDLVIAVDTMVAHLAGALNRPTWLLLKHEADWRWGAMEAATPWYPSMRLYRQPAPGDWEAVLAAVSADLDGLRRSRCSQAP